mmetsp:Transcript_105407/g.187457  ORF Transcript_105407/g.187457 Transcript_105407/m.187457 type:complete len:588 (+) Transcript_105407:81-1844(+)
MGIQGLLPFLKAYAKRSNIKDFAGKSIGVDAMCWMHKGAFSCSQELVLGQDTDKFVHFFLRMCEILRFNEIKPIIVFDGDKMPSKAKEDERRNEVREVARKEAMELIKRREAGEHVDDRALSSSCEGAIKVTSSMISRLQSALRELDIKFMVAPYEADAQLAYMCRRGWVQAVISEDSDLLAYGCPNTFFKMDRYGDGELIALPCLQPGAAGCHPPSRSVEKQRKPAEDAVVELDDDGNEENADPNHPEDAQGKTGRGAGRQRPGARGRGRGKRKPDKGDDKAEKDIQLSNLESWSPEKFAQFCVFCGTDYKEHDIHIKGFGIKTAFKLMCKYSDAEEMLEWLLQDKKWTEKLPCSTEEYVRRYNSVVAVFWHHVVYDMRMGCVSIARSFPETEAVRVLPGIDVPQLCGNGYPQEVAINIVKGEIDPRTKQKRAQEPLTPAERAVLDRMLAQKRLSQRDHQFQMSLKENAQRIAKEKAEKEAALTAAAAVQEADAPPPVEESRPSNEMDENDGEEAPRVQHDLTLFSRDARHILSLREELMNSQAEAEGASKPPDETAPQSSNPFARKRASTQPLAALGPRKLSGNA